MATMKMAAKTQIGMVSRLASSVEKPKFLTNTGRKFPNAARLTFVHA